MTGCSCVPRRRTDYEDDEPPAGTTYGYRVWSVLRQDGEKFVSAPSGKVSATTLRETLGVPANLGATARRQKGKKKWKTQTVPGTSQLVRRLKPDTAYEFRLRAERTSGGTLYRLEAATAEVRPPRS